MFISCKSCCMWWLLFWYILPKSCYKYTNTGWQQFASMKEKRADILLESCTRTSSMLFGGYGGSSSSKTTELISIDGGVEYGPDLPEAVLQHAITLHYLNSVTPAIWRCCCSIIMHSVFWTKCCCKYAEECTCLCHLCCGQG